MKTFAAIALIGLAALLPSGGAFGQPPQPGAGPAEPAPPPTPESRRPAPGPPPADRAKEEQDLRALVETVKMARLTKELGLNDEQAVLLVRKYDEVRERLASLNRERQQLLRELREAVRAGKPEAEIERALDKLVAHDRKIAETRTKVYEEIGKDLTATQRAKLYVFMNDFENDMRRLVQRARESGAGRFLRMREETRGAPGEGPGLPPRPALRGRGPIGNNQPPNPPHPE